MAPAFVEKPGEVFLIDASGNVRKKKHLVLKVANNFKENPATNYLENNKTEWGSNLYASERQKKKNLESSSNKPDKKVYADDE